MIGLINSVGIVQFLPSTMFTFALTIWYNLPYATQKGVKKMDLLEPGRSRLPELLVINNMTARELSARIGCTEAHISQVISGKSYLSYVLA